MIKRKLQTKPEETFNPFEIRNNSTALMESLDRIDKKSISTRFKNADDPITLAFESLENISLKVLARDFVKESFCDIVSFVTDICK